MMFLSLFLKECKAISKSVLYFAFIVIAILFFITQYVGDTDEHIPQAEQSSTEYNSENPFMPPPDNAQNYGIKYAEIPELIMPEIINYLFMEWNHNNYVTYPMGFYKNIKLNKKEQAEIEQILIEITGMSTDVLLDNITSQQNPELPVDNINLGDIIPIKVSYEEFKDKMGYINKMLGGGSLYYNSKYFIRYGRTSLTYGEKLIEYDEFLNEDKITGAYARLYCDYMGVVIALFSVFVPVAFLMRDKRAKSNESIYSRDISSTKLVLIRYFALIIMLIIPFLLLTIIPSVQLTSYALKNGLSVDIFAFAKYTIGWLLPSLMAITAVAFVLTILTDTPVAIAVQFLWSLLSLITGSPLMVGDNGMNLIIRHNTIGSLQAYKDEIPQLMCNRLFYIVFSLVLIGLSILFYEMKRRGRLHAIGNRHKIFRNHKSTGETYAS